MPGGDGTGPFGQGPGIGKGFRRGGKARMKGNHLGAGPGSEECFCPNCGQKVPHQRGVPCYSVSCSKCGAKMVRR